MKKSLLEEFISKYSLGKICEKSHWFSDLENKQLEARAHTEEKTLILKVIWKDWEEFETCQIALPSANKVQKMLSPIGEDVSIELNKLRDRIVSFTVSDDDCEAVCTVADFDAFPEAKDVDKATLPDEFDVEIPLEEDLIKRISKSVSALSDADDFVFKTNKNGGIDMIINYETTNTNRIRIPLKTLPNKDTLTNTIGFSTSVFKSIISANPEIVGSVMKISDKGLTMLEVENENFISKYFMFPTRMI